MLYDDDNTSRIQSYLLRKASSPDEFPRILEPKNAEDWLLRLQADSINDHIRIYRVMLRRAQLRKSNTLLFDEHRSDFTDYLAYLPEYERLICEDIPRRYILTNNYDAMCLKTEFGKVVIVSEVLRYFLYFINIATMDLKGVPEDVRDDALVIAMRTLLLTEALDFDLDPRGVVPEAVHAEVTQMVKWQMKFIIGHEFAHHILQHGDDDNLYMTKARRFSDDDVDEIVGYRRQHTEEFEADLHSISVVADMATRFRLLIGGTSFLLGLQVFERLAVEMDPSFSEINTHPPTTSRVRKLIKAFSSEPAFDLEGMETVLRNYDNMGDYVLAMYRENPVTFTMYGSIYLGQWRGRVLIDRKDF